MFRSRIASGLDDNTALDRHREANTDNDTVEALKEKIERSGVEYMYYMVPTLRSRTVAKVFRPAEHFVRNLEKGVNFTRNALMDFQNDVHGNPIGANINSKEFVAMREADSFNPLPWERGGWTDLLLDLRAGHHPRRHCRTTQCPRLTCAHEADAFAAQGRLRADDEVRHGARNGLGR